MLRGAGVSRVGLCSETRGPECNPSKWGEKKPLSPGLRRLLLVRGLPKPGGSETRAALTWARFLSSEGFCFLLPPQQGKFSFVPSNER